MPTYNPTGWSIITVYKDGTTKETGPYSWAIAYTFAMIIVVKPWVSECYVIRA